MVEDASTVRMSFTAGRGGDYDSDAEEDSDSEGGEEVESETGEVLK